MTAPQKVSCVFVGPHIFVSEETGEVLNGLGSWSHDSRFPSIEVLAEASVNADVLMTWASFPAETVEALSPRTKAIVCLSTGIDGLVSAEARELLDQRGVTTMFTPGYATEPVAEFNIAAALSLGRRIVEADRDRRVGPVSFMSYIGKGLPGSTFGVVGLGNIGNRTAELADSLGANVIAWTKNADRPRATDAFVERTSLDDVFSRSDFVAICLELNEETAGVIGDTLVKGCPENAIIINTARPGVMDPVGILGVLQSRPDIQMLVDDLAGNDPAWKPVLDLPTVTVTPHIAFNTMRALHLCTEIAARNVESWLAGAPTNQFR